MNAKQDEIGKGEWPGTGRVGVGLLSLVCCVLLVVFGTTLSRFVVAYAGQEEQRHLIEAINAVASQLDPGAAAALAGSPGDIDKPEYQKVREYLASLRAADPDYRFAYLMGRKQGKIVFLADAGGGASAEFSAPGAVYPEATQRLRRIFDDGRSFVEGPLHNAYGGWFSVHAPIFSGGRVIAALGVDIRTARWRKSTVLFRLFAWVVTLLLGAILAIFLLALCKISRNRNLLLKTNRELAAKVAQVKSLEGLISICALCKKVRNDEQSWQRLEEYLAEHAGANFSHGICPSCYEIEREKIRAIAGARHSCRPAFEPGGHE